MRGHVVGSSGTVRQRERGEVGAFVAGGTGTWDLHRPVTVLEVTPHLVLAAAEGADPSWCSKFGI